MPWDLRAAPGVLGSDHARRAAAPPGASKAVGPASAVVAAEVKKRPERGRRGERKGEGSGGREKRRGFPACPSGSFPPLACSSLPRRGLAPAFAPPSRPLRAGPTAHRSGGGALGRAQRPPDGRLAAHRAGGAPSGGGARALLTIARRRFFLRDPGIPGILPCPCKLCSRWRPPVALPGLPF